MNTRDERLKTALQAIARREVAETTNIWPQIAARLKQKEMVTMKPKLKILWTALLVLLGLALISGVAYALYNYFKGDAGMEAVSQAGMVSELNSTALPTPLPTMTPLPTAAPLGTSQTLHGVTLTLKWVYLDDMWQAIGFLVSGLPADQRLGIPQLSFDKIQPEQYSGAAMALYPTENGLEGKYVVHQIVRNPETYMVTDTRVDVNVDIPLLDKNDQVLGEFRFTAPQVLVNQAPYGSVNTYAVRANGVEIRLEWVALTPKETRAKLCHEQPSSGMNLRLEQAVLYQAQNVDQLWNVSGSNAQQINEVDAEGNWRCGEVVFPPAAQDTSALRLVVNTLKDAGGADIPGAWEFVWSTLPQQVAIPGITPPLGSQTNGEVKVTLLQAYADALRVAVVFRIEGAPANQSFDLQLLDSEGKPFNTSMGFVANENDPSVHTVSLNFAEPPLQKVDSNMFSQRDPLVGGRFVGKLKLMTNPWDTQGGQVFTFDLDLPAYPALIVNPAQSVISEGLEMRLERLEITPSFTRAFLCYQKPSQADWMLSYDNMVLQIGQTQAHLSDYSLLLDEDYGLLERPEWVTLAGKARCVKAGFAIGHHNQPETLFLMVNGLEQSTPEAIPDDQLQMARQKLRQQGIEMDWVTFSGTGGGGAGPKITQKPDGMTDEEVLKRFYEALGYYYPATWTFTVNITP
jgi:hypothetical protein